MLEESGARMFWALSSFTCCQANGANETNAFAEGPPPIETLHVTIDE